MGDIEKLVNDIVFAFKHWPWCNSTGASFGSTTATGAAAWRASGCPPARDLQRHSRR